MTLWVHIGRGEVAEHHQAHALYQAVRVLQQLHQTLHHAVLAHHGTEVGRAMTLGIGWGSVIRDIRVIIR